MNFSYARTHAPLRIACKWQVPFLMFLMLITGISVYGQQRKTITLDNVAVQTAFRKIENAYQVKFFYTQDVLPAIYVTLPAQQRNIREILNDLEQATGLRFKQSGNMIGVRKAFDPAHVTKPTPIIKGRVTDRKGQPLPGTTIRNIISGKGGVTDANGYFSIESFEREPLLISSIGYRQQTVPASGANMQINMEEDATSLGGVVVMGYTTKQVKELTGAVQKITGEQLRSSVSSSNILSMLKAKTTGMYIVEPLATAGAKGQVLLRGESSLPSGSSYFGPLLVVDGVISTAQNLQDVVNPTDVESITILKDAASTAIYGSRAAQGVIVVSTKKAAAGSGVNVTVDTRYGIIKPNRAIRMMNTSEAIATMDKVMLRKWQETPTLQQQFATPEEFIRQRKIYSDDDRTKNFDWEKAMFNDGHFSDISLGINSGSERTMVYAGLDWYKEQGINYGNTFDRRNLRVNIVQNFSRNISGGVNLSAIIDRGITRNGVPELYMTQPFGTPYNNGTLVDSIPVKQSGNFGVPYTTWKQNFLAEKKYDNTSVTNNQHYTGTGWLSYRMLPWLTVKTVNTIDYINAHTNSYLDPRSYSGKYGGFPYLFSSSSPLLPNGTLTIGDTRSFNFTSTNTLNIDRQFGDHRFNFLAGTEWAKRTAESNSINMYNLLPGERNAGAARNFGGPIEVAYNLPYRPGGSYAERASFSAFGELNYNYQAKYYAATSVRTDAFTNFGRNKRYGTFYSVSAGWAINKEAFLADVKSIDQLKLRVVHGTSGRDVGDSYLNQTLYAINGNQYTYNDVNTIGAAISQLENPNISWETTVNNTAGIDLGLWKRIELSVDVYSKLSKKLLQQVYVSSGQGSFQQYQNVGEVENKGLEIMLNTRNIDARNFSWTTNLNISFNKNQIRKLYGDSLLDNYSRAFYRYVGEDINVIKAIKYVGVNPDNGAPLFQNYDASGKLQVVEGAGNISDIRNYQTVGSATPKFFGGFTNTFTYKQFSLSAEIWFQVGNYTAMNVINNFQDPTAPFLGRNNVNWQPAQKIWQQPGDKNANYPDAYSSNMNKWQVFSSRSSLMFGNASHLRMRNIRLGYDLSPKTLAKLHLQRAGVFVSADNVFVIKRKDYIGADPEGASIGNSTAYSGVGIGNANPRRITAGFNVTF
ncbi:SusC/RagA family TonB-linked outer membrane protein [Chitinophaga sp. 212800010-3]|uniref:SusC/RagA family TonB-linked outer membrane protein n=1 Tax=unclassified Chitinophaga TaxID=2619133 RepID=UPI002DF1F0F8|nr:TonB-linked outer membrane protein, SusC/RagA family [Chitinophaga sp. 212800010-3]